MILCLRVVWEPGNKPAILSTWATPGTWDSRRGRPTQLYHNIENFSNRNFHFGVINDAYLNKSFSRLGTTTESTSVIFFEAEEYRGGKWQWAHLGWKYKLQGSVDRAHPLLALPRLCYAVVSVSTEDVHSWKTQTVNSPPVNHRVSEQEGECSADTETLVQLIQKLSGLVTPLWGQEASSWRVWGGFVPLLRSFLHMLAMIRKWVLGHPFTNTCRGVITG